VDVLLGAFLTSTLDGDNWSASIYAALLSGRQIPVPIQEAVWIRQRKVSAPAWDQTANPQSHSPYISIADWYLISWRRYSLLSQNPVFYEVYAKKKKTEHWI
jgi:hypothetical protein